MTTVAFDTDGTLIYQHGPYLDTPRYDIIQLFHMFQSLRCKVYMWSGGGVEYCEHWRLKLGLDCEVVAKGSFVPDIAIDDEEVKLGKVNIRV